MVLCRSMSKVRSEDFSLGQISVSQVLKLEATWDITLSAAE